MKHDSMLTNKTARIILLFCVVAVAAFLRFYKLGEVPISPDWDEAALGYNAYSVLHTGKDEYGTFLPRSLRSFDDYKPPLYMYLAIPSVKAFGLNTKAVRIPSAVMGTLSVLGVYFLVKTLFAHDVQKKRRDNVSADPVIYALLSSFLLAISPWHLQFSRIAFEANIGLGLNIWGMYAFLRGRTSARWLAFSAFLFALALYAYHSERVFAPLMVILMAVFWKKQVFTDPKRVVVAVVVGLLTVMPLLPVVLDKTSVTRLKGTSTLSDQTGLLMRSVSKLSDDLSQGDRIGALFENRRIVYARTLFDGYISHFSLKWLFLTGDNDRHHAPDNALMYLWELPFLLSGIFLVWKRNDAVSRLLVGWLLVAPIAASPTSETPHAIRTLVVLPSLQIFVAVGLLAAGRYLVSYAKKGRMRMFGVYALSGVFAVAFISITGYYFHMYYTHMNFEYAPFWQYGYKEAVDYTEQNKKKFTKIVVSTKLEQPHMFYLFYTKYDPKKYLAAGGTASGGFKEVKNTFDVYEFRPIPNWADELHDGTVLYVGTPKEIPSPGSYVISNPDGTDAIHIAQ